MTLKFFGFLAVWRGDRAELKRYRERIKRWLGVDRSIRSVYLRWLICSRCSTLDRGWSRRSSPMVFSWKLRVEIKVLRRMISSIEHNVDLSVTTVADIYVCNSNRALAESSFSFDPLSTIDEMEIFRIALADSLLFQSWINTLSVSNLFRKKRKKKKRMI